MKQLITMKCNEIHGIQRNTMRNHEIQGNTRKYYAIQSNTMKYNGFGVGSGPWRGKMQCDTMTFLEIQ